MRNRLALYVVTGALASGLGVGCSRETGKHADRTADQAGQTAESAARDIQRNTEAAGRDLDHAGEDLSQSADRAGQDIQQGIDQAADQARASAAELDRQRAEAHHAEAEHPAH